MFPYVLLILSIFFFSFLEKEKISFACGSKVLDSRFLCCFSCIKLHNFFVFDYRGFGKSGGEIRSENGLFDDTDLMFEYVLGKFKKDKITLNFKDLTTIDLKD